MVEWLHDIFAAHPEIALFLVLGIGHLLGRLRFGTFTLGAVTGTLIAGVVVGQLGVKVSPDVKITFFLLCLFSIGFRIGPQFFQGLRGSGLAQAALGLTVTVTGLGVAYVVSRFLHYDVGTAAGMLAGSLTESAALGTALDAISRLPVPPDQIAIFSNRIPVAFAVTYLIGVVGAAFFLSQVAPKILGVNLADACRELETELRKAETPADTARSGIECRTFEIGVASTVSGTRVGDFERAQSDARYFVERIRRRGEVIDADEALTLEAGDIVALTGPRDVLVEGAARVALREVHDVDLIETPGDPLDVVVTQRAAIGRTISDLRRDEGSRGIYLRRIMRNGAPVPNLPTTRVERGDVLTLVGPARRTAAAARTLGFADRPTNATDMVLVSLGIVAGALIGLPALTLAGLHLGLSESVGVLLGGLACGWLRSVSPRMVGRVPGATLWLLESIGLTVFVAVVGLDAGPDFLSGLQANGLTLVAGGLVTMTLPHLTGVLLGKYVFKMHPGVVLGVCAGAGTAPPALAALQDVAHSSVPATGFGVAYAVGHVTLALWGSVIVLLLA